MRDSSHTRRLSCTNFPRTCGKGDLTHFFLRGVDVGTRHIQRGSNPFQRTTKRFDDLPLFRRSIGFWIKYDAGLRTPKWEIGHGILPRHRARQATHFRFAHTARHANTAFTQSAARVIDDNHAPHAGFRIIHVNDFFRTMIIVACHNEPTTWMEGKFGV